MTEALTRELTIAIAAARAGGAVVQAARRDRTFRVSEKSRADYVTEVDVAAERAIVAVIRAACPEHVIIGEEGTAGPSSAPDRLVPGGPVAPPPAAWIIDPLDGTTNFIRDIPWFAVAVGFERQGRPEAAAILDPIRGELFTAARGRGAFRDGRPIQVSDVTDPGRGIVLTGIPFKALEHLPAYLPELDAIARCSAGIRRLGSAALDLCLVASGGAEAFWEHGLARWDVSAGSLIVEEAGGRVSDLCGGASYLETGDTLVSNGHLHAAFLDCLRKRVASGPAVP